MDIAAKHQYLFEHEPKFVNIVRKLLENGQEHLLQAWDPPGVLDDLKMAQLKHLVELDKNYPIDEYVSRARQLLSAAQHGTNAFDGLVPSPPSRDDCIEYVPSRVIAQISQRVHATHSASAILPESSSPSPVPVSDVASLESLGVGAITRCVFVLVAGGIGERLGSSHIKVALPHDPLSRHSYLRLYCDYIRHVHTRVAAPQRLPLVVMTSQDTHAETHALLERNDYFGLPHALVVLLQQEGVCAVMDARARIATMAHASASGDPDAHVDASPAAKYSLVVKPHGHGDVHRLLCQLDERTGCFAEWARRGAQHVFFFQDTNPLVFRGLPAMAGAAVARGWTMTTMAVPRREGDAVGALCSLNPETDATTDATYAGEDGKAAGADAAAPDAVAEADAEEEKAFADVADTDTDAATGSVARAPRHRPRAPVCNVEYNQLLGLFRGRREPVDLYLDDVELTGVPLAPAPSPPTSPQAAPAPVSPLLGPHRAAAASPSASSASPLLRACYSRALSPAAAVPHAPAEPAATALPATTHTAPISAAEPSLAQPPLSLAASQSPGFLVRPATEPGAACYKQYSKYPGNTNVLLLALPAYADILRRTRGHIAEFVNPKFADAARTRFPPVRLECMMQDVPTHFRAEHRSGVVLFPQWFCFSPVKNALPDARAKLRKGLGGECAVTSDADVLGWGRRVLALMGVLQPLPPHATLPLPPPLTPSHAPDADADADADACALAAAPAGHELGAGPGAPSAAVAAAVAAGTPLALVEASRTLADIRVPWTPLVMLDPALGLSPTELAPRFTQPAPHGPSHSHSHGHGRVCGGGGVWVSPESVLWLQGDVRVRQLGLRGALRVVALPGASATVCFSEENAGARFEPLAPGDALDCPRTRGTNSTACGTGVSVGAGAVASVDERCVCAEGSRMRTYRLHTHGATYVVHSGAVVLTDANKHLYRANAGAQADWAWDAWGCACGRGCGCDGVE